MNDLEKLIYLHDPKGDAKTFLLTRAELNEIIEVAYELGWDRAEDIFKARA